MEKLNKLVSVDYFFDELAKRKKGLLFLDYDGTLSEFTPDRNRAFPYPGVMERLEKLIASNRTHLVLISGRTIADLKKLIKMKTYPEIIGSHGAERLMSGQNNIEFTISDKTREGLANAQKWARQNELMKYCEIKLSGLSFHWRGIDDDKKNEIKAKLIADWKDEAAAFDLELHEFDGGIELRYAKANKGLAAKSILAEHGDNPVVAYLGDDKTDEEAFEALEDKALKVLVRKEFRPTKADLQLCPPEELLEFLDRWIKTDNKL